MSAERGDLRVCVRGVDGGYDQLAMATVKRSRRLTDEAIAEMLGNAMRITREEHGYSQAAVADRLGVHQATVSSIELGQRCASIAELRALEHWWRLPDGYIERRAGLIADTTSARAALENDPQLDANARKMLLAAYDAVTRTSRR
jgi:transcriptional regulator with XRE-family HTH domain